MVKDVLGKLKAVYLDACLALFAVLVTARSSMAATDTDPFAEVNNYGQQAIGTAGTLIKLMALLLYGAIIIVGPLAALFIVKKKQEQKGAENPWIMAFLWAGGTLVVAIVVLSIMESALSAKYSALAPSNILNSVLGTSGGGTP